MKFVPSPHWGSIKVLAAAFAIVASMLLTLSYSASPGAIAGTAGVAMVNALVARVSCQSSFAQGYLNSVAYNMPSISGNLAPYSASLSKLRSAADGYSGSANVTAVQDFVSTSANPLFPKIAAGLQAQFNNFGTSTNLSNFAAAKGNVGKAYYVLLSNYSNCSFAPDQSLVEAKQSLNKAGLSQAVNYTNKLASYGINVSALDAIIAGANSSITTPLGIMAGNATSNQQLEISLGLFCLYDGCTYHQGAINSVNYHLAAKMNVEGAQLILDKIRATDSGANAGDLDAAQSYIDNASTLLTAIGPNPFRGGAGALIAQNLSEASSLIKQSVGLSGTG